MFENIYFLVFLSKFVNNFLSHFNITEAAEVEQEKLESQRKAEVKQANEV